ncbi:MAG: lipid IV(A) 3-deoxy-D-manno-octulosonic acid transferase [Thiopseudomonas sp.]|nr:lipid IV(A) 3-deoxy-D-manno-octulosonic acid transferase [Thiopseudomonas sp.]
MNRTLYSILLYLALPLIAARLWWRGRKAPAYRQRIGERFALGLPALKPGGIWLHAVSVGESIAAAPVVRALQERYPQLPVTVTCMTPTGSERIRALFGDSVQHCYLPYDMPCRARAFLQKLQPVVAVVMETELWPNHIHQCARMNIPVVLANARLSERSARGYARFPKLTAPMLAQLSGIAVQTQAEAERFLQLGARPEAVQVTGSIKFDLHIQPQLLQTAQQLREQWQLEQRKVWIAGSTHEGEDLLMLEAHQQLLQAFPAALLILVPRHPERFDTTYRLCQAQGLEVTRRSRAEPVTAATRVLLGDTMGEMLLLYALADVALVGGSLVPHGGHNLLEPVALGKPVLSGSYVQNFLEIAGQLKDAGALREVSDARETATAVARLWTDQKAWQDMQQAGQQVLKANQGALERLLKVIGDAM